MIVMLAQCVFWVSGACVAYSYVLYPGFIYWAARFWGRSPARPQVPDAELPTVTLLIAAHNEESVIADRIENSLNLDYPAGRLEVVVALDGCSDRTAEIVRNYESRGVRVLDNPSRQGKAATLNAAIARLTSEILILSDANTSNERSAARRLVSWFADLRVGVVCGRLILTDPRTGRNVDSLYWRYETFLKRCEATLGALLGANGAIYAIRRSAFVPLQPNTIIDDFVIPLQSKLRTGCSIVYDAEAIAWEETPARLGAEFGRRARIGAGAFQSLRMLRPIFHPCQGWLLLSFVSHKLLRWFCPLFLLALFMATVPLVAL